MKADNILVEESGICKISDFGISKRLQDRSRAFSFKGTAFWMAPETLSHFGKGYDIKIDIWSVGCVVHEMWTALRPWAEVDFLSAMCKVKRDCLINSKTANDNACFYSFIASRLRG